MTSLRQLHHVLAAFLIFTGTAFAQQDLRIAPARDRDIAPRLVVTGPVEQPVRLQSVSISVDLLGGLAQTDVLLVFRNPNRRVLEGELQFPLLAGQQVTAFALDVDGRMRDAVPVEKDKGRQVFEDIVRRGIDPGLLEATQGNNYKLRIYPLPAQGTRSVRLRIAEPLTPRASGRVYRLALAYGDNIPQFSLAIRARGASTPPAVAWRNPEEIRFVQDQDGFSARLERHDYLATGFLEVTTRQGGPLAWAGEFGAARYFFAELPLRGASAPRRLPKSVALVWDSSASGAQRDHAREFALLDAYFSRFGEGVVQLQRVRETLSTSEEFRITGGNWRALRRALEQTVYDGATNLGALTPLAGVEESLLFSDGLANFGEPVAPRLAGRVYAICAAARANGAFLRLLAEAAGGQTQLAVDTLHEVVVRPWHGRFPEIELITLAELNSIVARAKDGNGTERMDTSRIDPRLLRNLPLDLRVVLSWDADNTDIDLWVTDPNGEKAFYGNRLTYQGGRMSQDFTGGYGPEEFSLRNAKPGRYRIEAQFYGNRQQIVAGATTLQLKLATRFGTPEEAEKIVTLRLKGRSEVVLVGEFEVK